MFHQYLGSETGPTSATYARRIHNVRLAIARARSRAPWLGPEIVVEEWGFDPTASSPSVRDGAGAAFVASTLTMFADAQVDAANHFFVQDNQRAQALGRTNCFENCPARGLNMVGFGLLDRFGHPRPPYHAFRMFTSLGTDRIAAEPSFARLRQSQEWGAIATRLADGRLRVLARNWDPSRSGAARSLEIGLSVTGFEVGSWEIEEIGLTTDGKVVHRIGMGRPGIHLPPNHVVLLTLQPEASAGGAA